MQDVCLLQVFPGDVRVAAGSSPWWGSAKSQNISSECGQSLSAKPGVDEIQMCSHHHHCWVGCPCLKATTHKNWTAYRMCVKENMEYKLTYSLAAPYCFWNFQVKNRDWRNADNVNNQIVHRKQKKIHRLNPKTAPDVLVGTLHGTHCHQDMNVWITASCFGVC